MVILMISFQMLRFFCVAYGICAGRNFIHQVHQSMCGQWQKCYGSTFMRYLFIDPYSQILGQFIVSVKPGGRCVSLQSLVLNNLWIDVTDENELVGIYYIYSWLILLLLLKKCI